MNVKKMTPEQITSLIKTEISDSEVEVVGGDGKYQIKVVADLFVGMNAVKRQQAIYRIIEHISSGVIHAVNMLLLTRQEHAERK